MEDELSVWIANSNEAISLNLTRPGSNEPVFEEPFHPAFTYAIFGEDEAIFGYKELELNLNFRANDLKPSLDIKYAEKWKPIGETKAMNLEEMLKDFFPEDAFKESSNGSDADATSSDWTPPGKKIRSYMNHGRNFEIWCAGLADPAAKEILRRMQILVPFYIEGGTCQDLDDQPWTIERWKLFLLYEVTPSASKSTSPYTFAGFSTSYRLWVFPTKEILRATGDKTVPELDSAPWQPPTPPTDPETFKYRDAFNPLDSPSRERISQFVILPPYQGQSHGSQLYNAMVTLFLSDPHVFEITVEDPNEAFDDLRDWSDLARLRTDPVFSTLSLPDTLPASTLAPTASIPVDQLIRTTTPLSTLRHRFKLAPRQFARLLEMHLLSTIPPRHRSTARITRKEKSADPNDRRYYFWRLLAKERLYRHNRDQLAQLERAERVEKVEETCRAVEADYARLLEGAARRAQWGGVEAEDGAGGSAEAKGKRKARVIEEDEEDEEEKAGVEGTAKGKTTVAAKRPKV